MSIDQSLSSSNPPVPPDAKGERPKKPDKAVAHSEQENTPAKPHSAHNHSFRNGTLPRKRAALMEDLGFLVPEAPLDVFEDFYLPPLNKNINLEEVYASLKDDPDVLLNERWTAFQIDPAQSPINEDATFGSLQEIFNKMTEFAIKSASESAPDLKETVVLSLQPKVAPGSEKEGMHRPDAFFIRRDAENLARDAKTKEGQTRWWYDIALIGEFKKKGNADQRDDVSTLNLQQDVSKIVYNMQYVMSLDPCRRFTFGFTIEDHQMRLWFCSRAVVAVSAPFNFATKWQQLTRIFAFASETELGWDPTIRPFIEIDKKRAYYIDVGDKTYKTVDVLSDFAADALIGRATRVFTVQEKGSDEEHVLKDMWEFEHVIHQRLLSDIERKFGPEIRNEAARYLLTPIAHQLVPVEASGEEDHTTKVMMRGKPPSFDKEFKLILKEPQIDDNQKSVGFIAASDMETSGKRWLRTPLPRHRSSKKLQHRRHYRIVFKELAKPIHTLRKLSDVFTVLRDIARVLQWIHACGWVHRDICVGNLYLFEGRGLLGDLEYAKHKLDNAPHEVRTGTVDFMATEALRRDYMYLEEDVENLMQTHAQGGVPNILRAARRPFFHNDLHDLESLWWIGIWELFFHRDKSEPKLDEAKAVDRYLATQNLFPGTMEYGERHAFLNQPIIFSKITKCLPNSFSRPRDSLNVLRAVLASHYKKYEGEFPNIKECTIKNLHSRFEMYLQECAAWRWNQ